MEYGKSHPAQDKPLPILQEKSAIILCAWIMHDPEQRAVFFPSHL